MGQDNDGIVKDQYASVSFLPCGSELNPTFKKSQTRMEDVPYMWYSFVCVGSS